MEKYEPLGVVGEGSYGVVLKCRHKESGKSVAIKKFIDPEDDQNVRKIALREIRVLRKLRHENLVNLLEVFRRRKHLYLVFEFIDHTLLDELESKTNKGLEYETCRKYIYQILRGLGFCHDNNIIHRDVKPENILVSKNGIVKLCDFGFARNLCGTGDQMTDYVATRWYRAPELLVGDVGYGKEVDIWAVGCLFSEMMTGEPLFPGDSDIDQLFLIAQCLGRLSPRHLSLISRNSAFRSLRLPSTSSSTSTSTATTNSRSNSTDSLNNKYHTGPGPGRRRKPSKPSSEPSTVFSKMFPEWDEDAVNFLTLCLDPEPSGRPSCGMLLRLPYFTKDSFPSRFINELHQKLQLESNHPILSSSTRKKRSVLGVFNKNGSNGNAIPTSNLAKKQIYQGRLNLNEQSYGNNSNNLIINNSLYQKQSPSKPSNLLALKANTNQQFSKLISREQTFLVDKQQQKLPVPSFKNNSKPEQDSSSSRIPLLNRKYSEDSLNSLSFSKSTPNMNQEHEQPTKRFSFQYQQMQQQQSSNALQQHHQQPRKFSFSFPDGNNKNADNPSSTNENENKTLLQPLHVTNLTFGLGSKNDHHLPVGNLSKGITYLNVVGNNSQNNFIGAQKRTPSPKAFLASQQSNNKNGAGGESSSSSYFPHFVTNGVKVVNPAGVSFYRGNFYGGKQAESSAENNNFLPRVGAAGDGIMLRDGSGGFNTTNQPYPRKKEPTTKLSEYYLQAKGVSKSLTANDNGIPTLSLGNVNNGRHFTTFGGGTTQQQ